MAEVTLPDLSLIWSSGGDNLKPSDTKIQQGWQIEVPPRQWFNWLDNRQDQALAHIAQHGISVWSNTLEYQANKSYVQGSDGLIYKALTTNKNINPVGDSGINWKIALVNPSDVYTTSQADAKFLIKTNNLSDVTNVNTARTNLSVYSKAEVDAKVPIAPGAPPIYGIRAWANFDGIPSTPAIRGSGNVASITKVSAGIYDVVFATAMPDANYSITTGYSNATTGPLSNQDSVSVYNRAATGFRIACFGGETSVENFGEVHFQVVR